MTHTPESFIQEGDLERFLAGELSPGSHEWQLIVEDLEVEDGIASRFLERKSRENMDAADLRWEGLWQKIMRSSTLVHDRLQHVIAEAEENRE